MSAEGQTSSYASRGVLLSKEGSELGLHSMGQLEQRLHRDGTTSGCSARLVFYVCIIVYLRICCRIYAVLTVRLFCSVHNLPTAQLSLQLARATMPSSSVSALQQRTMQAALLAAPSTPSALQQLTG